MTKAVLRYAVRVSGRRGAGARARAARGGRGVGQGADAGDGGAGRAQGTIVLLLLLLVVDRMPFTCIAASVGAQLCYNTLLGKKYPFVDVAGKEFLSSCVMLVVVHVLWIRHFLASYETLEEVMGFLMVTVWLVPFGLLLSLAANEFVLPGAPGTGPAGGQGSGRDYPPAGGAGKQKGLLLQIFDAALAKKDALVPLVTKTFPVLRRKDRVL